MYIFSKLFHPEIFQGKYKKKNYFEGWYFKIIDKSMQKALAIIPGISYGSDTNASHAFIQFLHALTGTVQYFQFDLSSFHFNKNVFQVEIGGCFFSDRCIRLNLENETTKISGNLNFENLVKYPKSLTNPGIMGPYSFVPFMECYHGIVNIHHDIFGKIEIDRDIMDFNNGFGYIEKDWGKSFPEAWIWLQSNHFREGNVSLMFSIAKIPWLGKSFLGFISFIRIQSKIYTFSSYSKAKLNRLTYDGNALKVIMEDKYYKIEFEATHSGGGILKAPKRGMMEREITECITAVVDVKLVKSNGQTVYEGTGEKTGLEIVNEEILLP